MSTTDKTTDHRQVIMEIVEYILALPAVNLSYDDYATAKWQFEERLMTGTNQPIAIAGPMAMSFVQKVTRAACKLYLSGWNPVVTAFLSGFVAQQVPRTNGHHLRILRMWVETTMERMTECEGWKIIDPAEDGMFIVFNSDLDSSFKKSRIIPVEMMAMFLREAEKFTGPVDIEKIMCKWSAGRPPDQKSNVH